MSSLMAPAGHLLLLLVLMVVVDSNEVTSSVRTTNYLMMGENITEGQVSLQYSQTIALDLLNNTDKAIRLTVSSSVANLSLPLFISIRQGRHLSSLTLPYIEAGHSYSQVSKTLCPLLNQPLHSLSSHMIYIDISSPSHFNISFNLSTTIVTDYNLRLVGGACTVTTPLSYRLASPLTTTVSVSSPIVHVFEYPDNIDRVLIKVTSLSLVCGLVSVQTDLCPVDQLLDSTDHRGIYQSIQKLGALNVKRPTHQNFVYIVITLYHHGNCSDTNYDFIDGLVTLNRSANYDPASIHDDELLTKTVTIEIGHTLSTSQFLVAMVTPLGFLIGFAVLILLWILIDGMICYRQHPACKMLEEGHTKEEKENSCKVERPFFLDVLKGDHWLQEMRRRTTPSPRSPDFISHEFARAYNNSRNLPGSSNNPYSHDQRPLMLPTVPSDQSFSVINEELSPREGEGGGHQVIDAQSVTSCSSFGIEMRIKQDFPSDEEEEEEEEEGKTNETSFNQSPSPSPCPSPSTAFFASDKRIPRCSSRKRDLSIVIEDPESELTPPEEPNHKEEEEGRKEPIPPTPNDTPMTTPTHKTHFNRTWLLHTSQYLHQLSIPEGKEFQKKYRGYWVYLLVLVIFYSLPVYQLVLTYQRYLMVSGNGDFCYYNSLCSHPLLGVSAFNNIWSNIGFLFNGVLFIIIAMRRRSRYRFYEAINEQCERDGKPEDKLGVPQYFGIYYAAGVALIGESIMSAAYHVCPTGSNYQFDTAMMFVLVILGLYQLFKCRNPDINPSPHKLLLILALLILFIGLGVIYTGLIFYIIFFCIFEAGVIYTSLQIYYRWRLKVSLIKVTLKELAYNLTHPCPPQHKPKLVYSLLSTVINLLFGAYGVFYQPTDFATFFLSIMIGNFITSLIYYVITKICYKEFGRKLAIVKSVIYLILAILFWIGGASLYSLSVTDWLESPAGSRNGNRECLILGFYDSHDLWHFCSSFALLFSFLLLMTLDDNEEFVNRSNLHVF